MKRLSERTMDALLGDLYNTGRAITLVCNCKHYRGKMTLRRLGWPEFTVGSCPYWFQWNDVIGIVIHVRKGRVFIHLRKMPKTRLRPGYCVDTTKRPLRGRRESDV